MTDKVQLSDDEIATGAYVLHSDIWQTDDHFVWSAEHSGWTTTGVSTTVSEAQTEIERQFLVALKDSGYDVQLDGTIRLGQVHFDA